MCIICVELDKKTLLPWEAAKNLLEYSDIIDEEHFEEVMDKIDSLMEEEYITFCGKCRISPCNCK
jgi:hypothetical protein